MTEPELRLKIRSCLLERDQDGLSAVMMAVAFERVFDGPKSPLHDVAVDVVASEELERLDHDLQQWWTGECNCDGHLN